MNLLSRDMMGRGHGVSLCGAIAVIAAAFADALVETASNAGLFGPGNFTDHSNLNVLPTLLVGLLFAGLHLFARIRRVFTGLQDSTNWLQATRHTLSMNALPRLLPPIFCIQIIALYTMETAEQFIVAGHGLGGTIWLGGPVLISLSVHALFCLLTAVIVSRALHDCAQIVFRIAKLVLAIATLPLRATLRISFRSSLCSYRRLAPVPCGIGERAPPFLAA